VPKPLVFVPEPIAQIGLDILQEHCRCDAPWLRGKPAGPIPAEAAAALVRIYRMDRQSLEAAPGLKVIAKHGVGLDNIDIEAATQHQVAVLWTPQANADAVAQHTLALMLALANRVKAADAALRQGHFERRMDFSSLELNGRVLGIIGLGRIGGRVAQRAAAGLGFEILAYDPYIEASADHTPARLVKSLDELLSRADFVSLHVPLTDETRHIINDKSLAHMQAGSYLVNTSRGAAVDEAALARALTTGHLAGAAIDVFSQEPPDLKHPLQHAPNVLLTPHVAGLSDQALPRVAQQAAEGIIDVLAGRRPASPVNPQVFSG
jgi:D-3-phosphoglycerate dehydrogenase / 2-oxoglutarate reductase